MTKKTSKIRAIRVNVNGTYSHTIGGDRAGQFSSGYMASRPTYRKSVKSGLGLKQKAYRALTIFKVTFCLTLFISSFAMCYYENHQPSKVEASTPELTEPPSQTITPLSMEQGFTQVSPVEYSTDELFDKYFGKDASIAKAVCRAESGLNEKVVSKPNKNGTRDYGICQVNTIHAWRVGGELNNLLDKETNIRVSSEIFRDNGSFNPWTCFKTGAYLRYL